MRLLDFRTKLAVHLMAASLPFLVVSESSAKVITRCTPFFESSVSLELEGHQINISSNERVILVRPSPEKFRKIEELAAKLRRGKRGVSINDLADAMEKSSFVFNLNDLNWVRIEAVGHVSNVLLSASQFLPELPGIKRAIFLEGEPTPLRPIKVPGVDPGSVVLKDDSRSTRVYGGNKPRKLEYFLGEATDQGATHIITTGNLGSNHAIATAAMGKAMGFKVIIVLNKQHYTEAVKKNLLAAQALGATIVYVKDRAKAVEEIVTSIRTSGQHPYVVPGGGKSALGEIGWVNAALELKSQIRDGAIAEPREIWLPAGTGGSAAGLLVGVKLAQIRSRLVFVDVTGSGTKKQILDAATATLELLKKHTPIDSGIVLSESDFDLVTTEVGAGFGIPSESSQVTSLLDENPVLDSEPVFMNKALGALLKTDFSRLSAAQPILYWSTFNGNSLPQGQIGSLPPEVRSALEEGHPDRAGGK